MPKVEVRKDIRGTRLLPGEYEKVKEENGKKIHISYEYRYRDKTNKLRSIFSKKLDDLRKREKEIQKDLLINPTPNDKVTVDQLYEEWKKIKKPNLKENVFNAYCWNYETYCKDVVGRMKIKDIKSGTIERLYNTLYTERNLSVSSIDNVHTVLHQVLERGVKNEYIFKNPSDKCLEDLKKAHNHEKKRVKALTKDEQDLFESFLLNSEQYRDKWYPFFITMLWTGMRSGEVAGLQWDDIDFDNNIIVVKNTLVYYDKRDGRGCGYSMNTPKTEAGWREVPILKKVKDALQMNKEYLESNNIKCQAAIDGYNDFVFLNRFGNPQHQGTLNKALSRIIRDCYKEQKQKNANLFLPKFSTHTLRHTFTTRAIERAVPLPVLMSVLGHKDVETTINIYNEVQKEYKQREMIKLEDFFDD